MEIAGEEHDPFEGEFKLPPAQQPLENLRQAEMFPQPAEDQ